MKKYFFLFLVLTSCIVLNAQNNKFPNDYLGVYKGDLLITNPKGKQKIPMEFHLTATDSIHKFNYKLVYNNSPRNYTLVVKDVEKGLYEIDENNGIILPVKLADNTLYSFFEVQGSLLSSRLAFKENSIDFEILFSALKNKVITGNKGKEIPEVKGYPISVVQRAVLTKE